MNISNPSQFFYIPYWEKIYPHKRPIHLEAVCGNPYYSTRIGNRTVTGQTVKDITNRYCMPYTVYSSSKRKEAEKTNKSDKADKCNIIEEADIVDRHIYDKKIQRRTISQIKINILTERVKHHYSLYRKEAKKPI